MKREQIQLTKFKFLDKQSKITFCVEQKANNYFCFII